ncbi:MAG: hypothetical protein O7G85_01490 [Planctomycetota bacterium]|nr:hypothetical protein [Planctomycetota bacterium]
MSWTGMILIAASVLVMTLASVGWSLIRRTRGSWLHGRVRIPGGVLGALVLFGVVGLSGNGP